MRKDHVPHSTEAEMAALGSCLYGPDPAIAVLSVVPDEAYLPTVHQSISKAIRQQVKAGKADIVSVAHRMKGSKSFAEAGGQDYLLRIMQAVPSPANAATYAEVVRDLWQRRLGIEKCRELSAGFADTDKPLGEVVSAMQEVAKDPAWINCPPAITVQDIDITKPHKGSECGIPWIDKWTGYGLPFGLVICSAYHKGGKTALSVQIARAGFDKGNRVLYATFADLSPEDLFRRMVRQECGWSERPEYSEVEQKAFDDAISGFSDPMYGKLEFYHGKTHGRDVEDFTRFVRGNHKAWPYGIIVVDYAQKIHSRVVSGHKHGKTAELEHISQELKEMADDLGVTVWLGSQITKGEKGEWITKYARGLEEDADMVFRIKREQTSRYAKIEVPFSRHSGVGETDVEWDSQKLIFTSPQYSESLY